MVLLIILAVILVLLAIILTAHARVDIGYGKDGPNVTVRFLFFSYRIVGARKKRIKKRDYKIGRFRRRRNRVMKKYTVKSKAKKPQKKTASSTVKRSIKERLEDIYKLFEEALKKFPGYLKIYCKKLVIAVGGKDAHDMAMKYGAVIQGVQYAITALGSYTNLYKAKNADVRIYPAFDDGKWRAEADFTLKMRTASGIRLGWALLKGYLRHKKRKNSSKSTQTVTQS